MESQSNSLVSRQVTRGSMCICLRFNQRLLLATYSQSTFWCLPGHWLSMYICGYMCVYSIKRESLVWSIRFRPKGVIVDRWCIHCFSFLSRCVLDFLLSGSAGMRPATVMLNFLLILLLLSTQRFKWCPYRVRCHALRWPWNLVKMGFLVWPAFWVPQFAHVIT